MQSSSLFEEPEELKDPELEKINLYAKRIGKDPKQFNKLFSAITRSPLGERYTTEKGVAASMLTFLTWLAPNSNDAAYIKMIEESEKLNAAIDELAETNNIRFQINNIVKTLKTMKMDSHFNDTLLTEFTQLILYLLNTLPTSNEEVEEKLARYDAILQELQNVENFNERFLLTFQKLRFKIALSKLRHATTDNHLGQRIFDTVRTAQQESTISEKELPLATQFLDQTRQCIVDPKNAGNFIQYEATLARLKNALWIKKGKNESAYSAGCILAFIGGPVLFFACLNPIGLAATLLICGVCYAVGLYLLTKKYAITSKINQQTKNLTQAGEEFAQHATDPGFWKKPIIKKISHEVSSEKTQKPTPL